MAAEVDWEHVAKNLMLNLVWKSGEASHLVGCGGPSAGQ